MVALNDYSPEGLLVAYDGTETVQCDERTSGTTVCPSPGGLPFAFNITEAFQDGADVSPWSWKGSAMSSSSAA